MPTPQAPRSQTVRTCLCPEPSVAADDPSGKCRRCSSYLRPEVRTTPDTFEEFRQRLAESMFNPDTLYKKVVNGVDVPPPGPPAWFQDFIAQCRERWEAGQIHFNYSEFAYLNRDNPREGQFEASDGLNYSWFSILHQRQALRDEEWELALTAARHFAEAHRILDMLARSRHLTISDGDPEAPSPDPPSPS